MMNYEEAKRFLDDNVWGDNADDTKAIGRILIEVDENLRIANLLKLIELGLVSGEETEALKAEVRQAVGLPAQQPLPNQA